MIEIISGVYGYRPRKGVVEPKRSGDAPFSLPAGQEEALVKKGIAGYVSSGVIGEEKTPTMPAYDTSMSLVELKEVALCYGVTEAEMKTPRSKAAVIAAIEAKLDPGGDEDGDEDESDDYNEDIEDEGSEDDGGGDEDDDPDPDAPSLEPEEPQA